MKIACITDDGQTISQHFGRAPYYVVVTIEDGKVVDRKMISKLGHEHFSGQETGTEGHGDAVYGVAAHGAAGHGQDAASHDKHVSMAEAIRGCEALLCQGMGYGAYQSMERVGIRPVVTDISDIDEAVQAYIEGRIVDHTEKLH
ncbi:MAG: NifB/NifX family molybdenum-iron cluster-binding protein [Anaerolineae bacterium]